MGQPPPLELPGERAAALRVAVAAFGAWLREVPPPQGAF